MKDIIHFPAENILLSVVHTGIKISKRAYGLLKIKLDFFIYYLESLK